MKQRRSSRRSLCLLVSALATMPPSASAVSVVGGAKWGTPGNSGEDLKLGFAAKETCFLVGVTGSLIGNPHVSGQGGALPAAAEVFTEDGFWWVRTRAGVGPGVMAHVACIAETGNRVEFSWSDNLSNQGVPATANRECFLRKVWATSGLSGPNTQLALRKEGAKFTLNASHVENVGGESGFGGATAVCVDVKSSGEWGFTYTGPTNATNSATDTLVLRNHYPNGPPVPVDGVACFLTEIGGRWISGSPDPLGWDNGAVLVGDPDVKPYWHLEISNGRRVVVRCR